MIKRIRSLSNPAELVIVVVLAFGYFILTSLVSLPVERRMAVLSDTHLVMLALTEIVLAAILLAFLFLRGWSFGRLGFGRFDLPAVMLGIGLFMITYAAIWCAWIVAINLFGLSAVSASAGVFDTGSVLSLTAILLICIVNPIFEETFLCGYLLSLRGPQADNWTYVHVSVAVRLLYHLYQGAIAAVTVVPIGLVFSIWYHRYRQIWPLIVAHALFDLFGLLRYAEAWQP